MTKGTIHILGISGSLRSASSNSALIRVAAALAPADVSVTVYEELDQLPYFSPELDTEGAVPPPVEQLRHRLKAADAVLFSTPEYAFGVPGVLKNALDWIVSSGELAGKPVAVISASPLAMGGDKANASLVTTLSVMSARITEATILTIPVVRTKLDAAGNITDLATAQALAGIIAALEEGVRNAAAL